MKDVGQTLVVFILSISLFIWSIRDIIDGEVRNFNGFPNYKKNESPINFWFISMLRLVCSLVVLAVIIYHVFAGH